MQFYRTLKCDIFPKLRSAFDAVRLRVPFATETREDLHEMQQIVSNGTFSYSAPRTAAGHSDRCTALALAVRAAARIKGVQIPPFTFMKHHSSELD